MTTFRYVWRKREHRVIVRHFRERRFSSPVYFSRHWHNARVPFETFSGFREFAQSQRKQTRQRLTDVQRTFVQHSGTASTRRRCHLRCDPFDDTIANSPRMSLLRTKYATGLLSRWATAVNTDETRAMTRNEANDFCGDVSVQRRC